MDPELLARIAELLGITTDEVAAMTLEDVADGLSAAFTAAAEPENGSAPDLDVLTALTEATEGVRAAIDAAAEAEAAEAERVAELRQRMTTATAEQTPDPEPEPQPEPEPEAEPTPEGGEAEPVGEPAAEPEPQAVAAAGIVRMRRRTPPQHVPQPDSDALCTLTAAADVPGFGVGSPIGSLEDLGRAFADRVAGLQGARGIVGKIPIAKFRQHYPEERVLTANDRENRRKINNVISPQAITAAGGNCAPVANRYDFENISVDDRPVRDSLPRFNADRGGINVPTSPLITAPDAGVDIVTEAEDTSGATKPCVTVTCPTYSQVDVSAIYQCIEIGNFSRRFFPELFADWWALAGALHARKAEGNLLDGIGGASTQVTDGQNLGAARDLLESWVRAAAIERSTHRMRRNQPVELLAPAWLNDLMRMDLAREVPGAPVDRLAQSAEYIDSVLRQNYINVTWYLDTETGEGMVFAAQGAGALTGWPLSPVSYMYPTGGYLFLDGGELDLGTEIRDTERNEENNVRAFTETFENIVRVGQWSLEITNSICVSGSSSLPVVVTCPENS